MRTTLMIITLFAVSLLQAQNPATISLSQLTANNTSTSDSFAGQPNGNPAGGNISKLPIRSLLYPGATTKIYAHVEPWWGSGSHPDIGYNSQDPAQVHRQVQDMVSRGIDGAVVDWYGPGSYEDAGVKQLIAEAEATPNFSVLVEIDVGAIHWHSCYPGCSATTAVINLFTAANNEFFSSPAIARWNGRPLLMEFGFETLSLPSGASAGWNVVDWNAVQAQVPGNPALLHRNLGGDGVAQTTGAFVWLQPETLANFTSGFDDTADLIWFYSNTLKSYSSMATYGAVWKGFNDTIASWSPSGGRHIDQSCGQTWLNTFAKINQYYSASNQLPAMQLITWNDYEEGTEVETGIDSCLQISPSISGSQLTWTVTGNEGAIDHYTVYASSDGTNAASLGDFDTGTHSVDLSSFTLSPGSYKVYVQAVGKPSIRNVLSSAVAYTIAPPPPNPPTPPATTGGGTTTTTGPSTSNTTKQIALSATPAAQSVQAGQSGNYTLTVSQVGASDPVQLSCSGLPAGMSCNFSPASVTPGASGTQVQMSVTTATQTAQSHEGAPVFALMFPGLGLLGLMGTPATIRRRRKLAAAFVLLVLVLTQVACGGAGAGFTSTTTTKTPQTAAAQTYTITVNAVSGSVVKSTVVTLTVG